MSCSEQKNYSYLNCHFFLFAVLISINAQKKKLLNPFETNGDLNSQFIYLEKTSTNYKEYKVKLDNAYKVISKGKSLSNVKKAIANLENTIKELQSLDEDFTIYIEIILYKKHSCF